MTRTTSLWIGIGIVVVVGLVTIVVTLTRSASSSKLQPIPEASADRRSESSQSVAPTLSFTWDKDGGQRATDGSVPYVHPLADGWTRLYYCAGPSIVSAISQDGLTFTKEPGVRIAPGTGNESVVCDPTLVDLEGSSDASVGARVRMYYKGADSLAGGPGQSIHKIYSAVSSDGLTFTKEGLRIDSETSGDKGWASVPDAITLPDGRVRLYYVTAASGEHGIGSAISKDGLTFTKEPGLRVPNLVDPALVKLGDRYLLFAASIDERFAAVPKGIYQLESTDGLTFGDPVAVFQGSDVYDPSVLKIDDQTLRVFYGHVVPPQLPAVESHTGRVVTDTPKIASSTTCQSDPSPIFTHDFTDPTLVSKVVPPVWTNAREDLILHALLYTEGQRAPIRMPADGELINGIYYDELGQSEYRLDFRVSCEVTVVFDHITEVIEPIVAAFPSTPQQGSRSEPWAEPKAALRAGELVGYTTGTITAKNWNVGISSQAQRNDTIPVPEGENPEKFQTVACPFDYFSEEIAARYREKFVTADKDISVPYPMCR